MKKNKKKKLTFKRVLKITLRNTIYLIVAIAYLIYLLFKGINKLTIKLFNKLPKALKITLIYILVIGNIPYIINVYNMIKSIDFHKEVAIVETLKTDIVDIIEVEKVETIEETETIEEVKNENICFLTDIECKIYNKALEKGMTENQAYLLLAISKHETANWTSQVFKNKNNLGGLYNGSQNTFYSYDNLDSGVEAFVNLLQNRYFNKGLNTIEDIGNVYCPVGASNDPNNLNVNWIPKVTLFYNLYLGK